MAATTGAARQDLRMEGSDREWLTRLRPYWKDDARAA
jgi:hypothetical protein